LLPNRHPATACRSGPVAHMGIAVCGRRHSLLLVTAMSAVLVCLGCDSQKTPTSAPSPTSQPVTADSALIAPESHTWTRELASQQIADVKLGISAAVRLVRLSAVPSLCVPDGLSDQHVRRLRLVRLRDDRWALGMSDRNDQSRLRAALLISLDGIVTPLADGIDEELICLHVSEDSEVFPHLAILPGRVLLLEDGVTPAIVLEPEQSLRFDLTSVRSFSYVSLSTMAGDEAAQYRWDPYELAFMGPAIDALPDPPGGTFHIDLDASERFEPLGGELPETIPLEEPPPDAPAPPEQPYWDPDAGEPM